MAHEHSHHRERTEIEIIWLRSRPDELATKHDLAHALHIILMNAQQLETLLNNQTTQIGKIAKEQSDRFDALVAANKVLQAAIDAGNLTPEIDAAAAKVQSALDNLDASIPDAPA